MSTTTEKPVVLVTRPPLPPEVDQRVNHDFRPRIAATPESLTPDDSSRWRTEPPLCSSPAPTDSTLTSSTTSLGPWRSSRREPLATVGLDVFEHEPEIDPRYFTVENAFLMPHLAAATIETQTRIGMLALDNIDAVLSGRPAPTLVTTDE